MINYIHPPLSAIVLLNKTHFKHETLIDIDSKIALNFLSTYLLTIFPESILHRPGDLNLIENILQKKYSFNKEFK